MSAGVRKSSGRADGIADELGERFCLRRVHGSPGHPLEGRAAVDPEGGELLRECFRRRNQPLLLPFQDEERLLAAAGPLQGVQEEPERPFFGGKEPENVELEAGGRNAPEGRNEQEQRPEGDQAGGADGYAPDPGKVGGYGIFEEGEETVCHSRRKSFSVSPTFFFMLLKVMVLRSPFCSSMTSRLIRPSSWKTRVISRTPFFP